MSVCNNPTSFIRRQLQQNEIDEIDKQKGPEHGLLLRSNLHCPSGRFEIIDPCCLSPI